MRSRCLMYEHSSTSYFWVHGRGFPVLLRLTAVSATARGFQSLACIFMPHAGRAPADVTSQKALYKILLAACRAFFHWVLANLRVTRRLEISTSPAASERPSSFSGCAMMRRNQPTTKDQRLAGTRHERTPIVASTAASPARVAGDAYPHPHAKPPPSRYVAAWCSATCVHVPTAPTPGQTHQIEVLVNSLFTKPPRSARHI